MKFATATTIARAPTSKSVLAAAIMVALGIAPAQARAQGAHGGHAAHATDSGQTVPATQANEPAAPVHSRTPIPALTDADREAASYSGDGHVVHDKAINYQFLFDELEWQDAKDGGTLKWDLTGWIGGDIDRFWLRSEGERDSGKLEHAEVQALWGHAVSPWWDAVGGIRQDFKPGPSQTWAAFGIQGTPLYNLESEITGFVGDSGQTSLRLKGEYDVLITNRLVLQPMVEVNFYGKNDPARGQGAGLGTSELGLRLRYEIRRELAPYIGVSWNRSYGNTADFVRADGGSRNETRFLVGVRMWF
ncbi:copper resistance protein B [Bordetella bronchialis]|uniref:copper resistance protein B n=1 Tax=Bordetella bronchialis TaxID=463025 RepID=UPI000AA1DB66|nr:copper resistance protein B [Bordetella bronchialis]